MYLFVNCQNIQNKLFTQKINLKSITNITSSNPVGGIGFVPMSVGCCQVNICRMGRSKFQTRSRVFVSVLVWYCVCVLVRVCVCVCVCVCVSTHELVSLYHTEL